MISMRFVCLWNVHDDFLSCFLVVVAFTRILHFSNRGSASTSQCDVVETFGPEIFIGYGGNEAPIKGRKVGRLVWEQSLGTSAATIWIMLQRAMNWAFCFAEDNAGKRIAARLAIMAMTTSNSIA